MTKLVERAVPREIKVAENSGMVLTIDPCKQYTGIKPEKLFEATGLIPYFVTEAALTEDATTAKQIMDVMNDAYGFGLGDYNMLENEPDSYVDDTGCYVYPGDPDLYPVVQFELETAVVYVYQYALVCVDDGKNQIMVRMD